MAIEIPIVIISYLILITIIGIYAMRKIKTFDDYVIGGHKMGLVVTTGTWLATYYSAVSMLGYPGSLYAGGVSALWYPIIWAVATIIGLFMMIRIRRVRFRSPPEYIRIRFESKSLQIWASILTIIALLVGLLVQFRAMGIVWSLALGRPFDEGIIIGALIVAFYLILGGFVATAYTDVAQAVVFTIPLVFGLIWTLAYVGSPYDLYAKASLITAPAIEGGKPIPQGLLVDVIGPFTIIAIVFHFIMWGCSTSVHPQYIQRVQGAKDIRTVILAYGISWAILTVVYLALAFMTLGARITMPSLPKGYTIDYALPLYVMKIMGIPILTGFLFAGILAAAMSTIDTVVNVITNSIVVDILRFWNPKIVERTLIIVARITAGVVTILIMFMSLYPLPPIIVLGAYAWGLLGVTYAAPVMLGLYWRSVNKYSIAAAYIVGLSIFITWQTLWGAALYGIPPLGPAVLAALIAATIVTLIVRKPARDEVWKPFVT